MDEINSSHTKLNSNHRRVQSSSLCISIPQPGRHRSGSFGSSPKASFISPFEKLSSPKNLINATLPSFLRGNRIIKNNIPTTLSTPLSNYMSTEPSSTAHSRRNSDLEGFYSITVNNTSDVDMNSCPFEKAPEVENKNEPMAMANRLVIPSQDNTCVNKRRVKTPENSKMYDDDVSYKKYVLASQPNSVLTIKSIQITNEELDAFKNHQILSNKVIDACMTIFKQKNHFMQTKHEIEENVLISNTEFSQRVFHRKHGSSFHAKNNPFKYNILLFPISVDQSWTLLSVNLDEFKIEYYDPLQLFKHSNEIFVLIYKFLKQELKHHENRDIEESPWRDFAYKKVSEKLIFSDKDSSVYILMNAYRISLGVKDSFSQFNVNEYRRFLHDLLLEYGKI